MNRLYLNRTYFRVITKKEQLMPFYITSIGSHIEQIPVRRENGENHHQLLYTLDGTGITVYDNTEHLLEPGSVYYNPPNTPQLYYPSEAHWTTLWITFSGAAFDSFFKYGQGVWQTDKDFDFEKKFSEIFALTDTEHWIKYSGVLLYRLLCECMEFIPQNIEIEKLGLKLMPALEYIHKNYADDIEIKKLAELTNVSFEHFCRIFKAYSGNRPIEYITAFRIKKAKEFLIKNPDCRIVEAAKNVGFESPAYFSKQFKTVEGITPIEFSRQQTEKL